jgi:DNA-binding GntR family transcriptional regulator
MKVAALARLDALKEQAAANHTETMEQLAGVHAKLDEFSGAGLAVQPEAVAAEHQRQQQTLQQVSPGTPLLSVERVAYTYNDTPMELRRGLYRTDSHHYHNVLG